MSKEKIEIINEIVNDCGEAPCLECMWCDQAAFAHGEALYNAGYRKIVLCRDCVWWEARDESYMGIGKCQNPGNGLFSEYTDDTDFCSYAKMKGGAE